MFLKLQIVQGIEQGKFTISQATKALWQERQYQELALESHIFF